MTSLYTLLTGYRISFERWPQSTANNIETTNNPYLIPVRYDDMSGLGTEDYLTDVDNHQPHFLEIRL